MKDLRIMKNQRPFLLVLLAIAFVGLFEDPDFGIGYTVVMFGVFAVGTVNYDSSDNGEAFLFTLPISRRGYVKEKYVLALLVTIFSSVIIGSLSRVSLFMRQIDYPVGELVSVLSASFMAAVIMEAVMIPLYLKYGAERSKLVILIIIGVAALGIYMVLPFGIFMAADLEEIFGRLADSRPIIVAGMYIAAVAVIVGISYALSCKIMKEKEF